MKLFLVLALFLVNENVFGGILIKIKKLECLYDNKTIHINECFVKTLENETYEFHFSITYIKEVKSLSVIF
jgi:hypothetical protein